MNMLNIFKKDKIKKEKVNIALQEEDELYVVETFKPCKITMTEELVQRQREEAIRHKYCRE